MPKTCTLDFDTTLNPIYNNLVKNITVNYVSSDVSGTIVSSTGTQSGTRDILLALDYTSITPKPKICTIQLFFTESVPNTGIVLNSSCIYNGIKTTLESCSAYLVSSTQIDITFHSFRDNATDVNISVKI